MRLVSWMALAALLQSCSAQAAVEQCRFIQAKPEREACYQRQEQELAARQQARAAATSLQTKNADEIKSEDDQVARSLRSICRGC